ncbi:MAG: bifunctional D-glycero-beta-D-manno-heptose-7-phosphate kinase/D-glycero-beta-D-manno-heptose 1-phosphate adenylyltransferase HldE [Gammaproteobacteria bacterium]
MTPDLSLLASARVLVVGDVMLDRYWHGPTGRISPEAPVPVVRVDQEEYRPGGAGNVALNISSLGCGADLVAAVGADENAGHLSRLLEAKGVNPDWVEDESAHTVTKLRIISRHQQLIRLDFENGFPELDAQLVSERAVEALDSVGAVIVSDYGKGTIADPQPLIQAAAARGIPVLVDPKGSDFERYRGASLITPNLAEFEAVVGPCADEAELVAKGQALIESLGIGGLLVTRSEQGMSLLRAGEEPVHLPTRAREVFDVTGAGDTVIAVFAAALAAGMSYPTAMGLSNLAAGIVVGKLGTSTVSVTELESALHLTGNRDFGVLDEAGLIEAVRAARARGEKVAMTNGCFDLLHAGHVDYLAKARDLADRLIVAVNDDASVRRLGKGDERPLNPLKHRMDVLSALSAVDWVVPFSEDTPERLICAVGPDVLVKGADYHPEQIAGHDCVKAAGGEVKVIQLVEGCSTTGIIEKIKRDIQ